MVCEDIVRSAYFLNLRLPSSIAGVLVRWYLNASVYTGFQLCLVWLPPTAARQVNSRSFFSRQLIEVVS
jgi:hypothetical protein